MGGMALSYVELSVGQRCGTVLEMDTNGKLSPRYSDYPHKKSALTHRHRW